MSVYRQPLTPQSAIRLQEELRHRVSYERDRESYPRVAGVDISVKGDRGRAAVVVLDAASGQVLESATAVLPVTFPYIPGLLSFREVPVILDAFDKLRTKPDLLLVDGQGIAHPRRFGIACSLGLELDLPAIGCGKSRLVGEHAEPGGQKGEQAPLMHRGEVIGCVLRTRADVKPVYVSIGHRVDLPTAVRLVLDQCTRYRLPEPIRWAHRMAAL